MMSKFSDDFNALPFDVRAIACNVMVEHQIRDLYFEAERLKLRYNTSKAEINEKIKYMERELARKGAGNNEN